MIKQETRWADCHCEQSEAILNKIQKLEVETSSIILHFKID